MRPADKSAWNWIQRGLDPVKVRIESMRAFGLTDDDARPHIYRAFLEREVRGLPRALMTEVHENYFSPREDAFRPRNMWSLSNAFTSAFKQLPPTKQFEVTARCILVAGHRGGRFRVWPCCRLPDRSSRYTVTDRKANRLEPRPNGSRSGRCAVSRRAAGSRK